MTTHASTFVFADHSLLNLSIDTLQEWECWEWCEVHVHCHAWGWMGGHSVCHQSIQFQATDPGEGTGQCVMKLITPFSHYALCWVSCIQMSPLSFQVEPDPEFPTVKFPNPEEGKSALVRAHYCSIHPLWYHSAPIAPLLKPSGRGAQTMTAL